MQHKDDWEFWLDCQLSPIIAKWMNEKTGYVFKSSYILSLAGLDDIYNKARDYGNIILVSKDSDISEIISRFGAPPKLVNLKIGNCDNRVLFDFLLSNFEEIIASLINNGFDIINLEK